MNKGTNFNAVTVINGNVSKPLSIQRGCHQWDSIAGYLFILAIEILVLLLKNSKIKPYKTKKGTEHLMDIYADDLTLYLEMTKNKSQNFINVRETMRIVEIFHRWSGLKVNRGKTYSTVFGKCIKQPEYVVQLGLK